MENSDVILRMSFEDFERMSNMVSRYEKQRLKQYEDSKKKAVLKTTEFWIVDFIPRDMKDIYNPMDMILGK